MVRRRSLLPFSVLDRYLLREVLGPTAVGFVTYTFFLLMRAIFSLAEQIFVRGVSLADAWRLLLVTVPHVAVLTIPMSFLFGVLIAVGRLNSDNEVVALQAGGVSLAKVLRTVVVLGFLLSLVNGYLTLVVMPEANRELRRLKVRLFASARTIGQVQPKVFYEGFPNLLLYIDDIDPETGVWQGVIMYDRSTPGEERLILARHGRLVNEVPAEAKGAVAVPEEGPSPSGVPWMLLEQAVTHEFERGNPETYRVNVNRAQLHKVFPKDSGTVSYSLGMRELSTTALIATVRGHKAAGRGKPISAQQVRLAQVELQKRLAIPAACVAFAFIALPLGIGGRSGGRGRGFILSIAVILVYYVMLNNGELLGREGRVPAWLGVWAPNIVLVGVALVTLRKVARWLGERRRGTGVVSRLLGGWRRWRTERRLTAVRERLAAEPPTGSIPIALQKRSAPVRFPTVLDRYLVSRLAAPLALVLASTATLYIVIDFADKIDELAKHTASVGVFLAYYWNLVPQVVLDVTPLALMIGVLILLSTLERNLELTAVKAGGISLYRVVVPIILVAVASALSLGVLEESIVPQANQEARRLLDQIQGRATARSYASADRQWLFSRDGRTLYNFLRYDRAQRTMIRLTLFRFDDQGALSLHLMADRVRYVNGSWIGDAGWFRQIYPDGTDEFRRITSPLELDITEAPSYFSREHRSPAQMSFGQLRTYIRELAASGYRPVQLVVRLHQKLTYPLSAFVMALLALPFGLNRSGGRRLSAMHGVALAMGLGIGYFLLVAVLGKMGEANLLPPALGAWLPIVLASLFALNRLTTLRT